MSKLNGTKLLTISVDMETYDKLKLKKGTDTWELFIQKVANGNQ
jgi:hypothetical protein